MMKINNSIFALCMCAGLALTTGTPIVGARADECTSLPDKLAAATATHEVVCSAMDDWSSGASEQRSNVENVQQELASAKAAVPDLTTGRDQAAAAVEEQETQCEQDQAAFDAASKALADKYAECEGHTDSDPCRTEIAGLITAMTQAGLTNSNCGIELNTRKGALAAASAALDNAIALVDSLTVELATAQSKEESTVASLQSAVNNAHMEQVKASDEYLTAVQACNAASDGLSQLLAGRTKRSKTGN